MSAIDTFRRAMRRHEKRARSIGTIGALMVADLFRAVRMNGRASLEKTPTLPEDWRRWALRISDDPTLRTIAFLYSLAADAVARLRVGLAEEARREQEEADAAPYVCPGCYAVGEETCASWCPDAAIERDREELDMYGNEEEDPYDCGAWDEVLP